MGVSAGRSGAGIVLALDLGGTRIRAAAVGPDWAVRDRLEERTPVDGGPDAVVEACARIVAGVRAAVVADTGRPGLPVLGVGVSAPGPVDPFRGVVVDPPNLGRAFRDVPLADRLGTALGLPAFLDRDTQVAARGEWARGAARGLRDFVYLTVSTGIGGAVVTDGRLLQGPDGMAGELGHLLVDRAGPPCGCGARGHLEAIASGVAIARAGLAAAERGDSPALAVAVRAAGRAAAADPSVPPIGAREVAAAADAGDEAARAILADATDAFAQACVTIVDVFDPDLIVVGGGLAAGLGDRLLAPARATVAAGAFRVPAARVRIEPAALGEDVGLVGARVLVAERLAARARRQALDCGPSGRAGRWPTAVPPSRR